MKHSTIILFMLLFVASIAQAQDIIVKKTGEELRVRIEEMHKTEIIFKYFDSTNNKLFVITKAEVFMVKYADGDKEVFNQSKSSDKNNIDDGTIEIRGSRYYLNGRYLNEIALKEIMVEGKNEKAIHEMNLAKSSKVSGNALIVAGIPIASVGTFGFLWGGLFKLEYRASNYGYSNSSQLDTYNTLFYGGLAAVAIGATSIIVGVTTKSQHKIHIQKAVKLYNDGLSK